MPQGKSAGVPCCHLTPEHACALFDQPDRPAFCAGLQPSLEMCRGSRAAALAWLTRLEMATRPCP
jgi:hypothetical protein